MSFNKNARTNSGFTLIELMIVVAVIGILAAIVYPSYIDFVVRNDRLDGKEALFEIQLAQERFKAQNGEYAATLNQLNISGTQRGLYKLDIDGVTRGGYTATATPLGNQLARDASCVLELRVNLSGEVRTPPECW